MVETVKGTNGQAPDATEDAVREHPNDMMGNADRPGYLRLRSGIEVASEDYMMTYAPLSLVRRVCEPISPPLSSKER